VLLLSAGIAVVDLDFDALEAVRQKMPIEQHRAKGRQQLAGQLG
jgi:predicted amidohydrolase